MVAAIPFHLPGSQIERVEEKAEVLEITAPAVTATGVYPRHQAKCKAAISDRHALCLAMAGACRFSSKCAASFVEILPVPAGSFVNVATGTPPDKLVRTNVDAHCVDLRG